MSVKTRAHSGECATHWPPTTAASRSAKPTAGGLEHASRAQEAHVDAHQHRDRDRGRDREGAPRRVLEGVDDDEGHHREQDDHDREDRDHGEEPRAAAHLVARHLPERAAVAAQREEEDHEVLHAAAEDGAGDEPERPRQVAELRRERRPDERPGAGDRREVVAEDHPAVRGHEVAPVVEPLGRRRARGVEREDARGDEGGVEAVRDEVRAERPRHEEDAVDGLAARERDRGEPARAHEGDGEPGECREKTAHSRGLLGWKTRSSITVCRGGPGPGRASVLLDLHPRGRPGRKRPGRPVRDARPLAVR